MLSVHQLETAFAATWPALETIGDGAWVARFGNGYTRRINSINVMDPADDEEPEARLAALAQDYRARDLVPAFRVTPLTGTATFSALETSGWQFAQGALILDMPIEGTDGFDADVTVSEATGAAFIAAQVRLQGYDAATAETLEAVIANYEVAAAGLVLRDGAGTPVASALCAQAEGIGVFLNVVTDPAHRKQGLGRRIMASGLSWLAENGAAHAALQVATDNKGAIALYLGMGLTYRYPYHYRRLVDGAEQ